MSCSPITFYYQSTQITSLDLCSFITYCFFQNFNSQTITFVQSQTNVNIEKCVFSLCSSNSSGGAIYLNIKNLTLNSICANKCKSSGCGQFSYTVASLYHIYNFCSFFECSSKLDIGAYCVLYPFNGFQQFFNINFTKNAASSYSLPEFHDYNSLDIKFNSIVNNYTPAYICIYFFTSNGPTNLNYSNFIGNNSPTKYGVIITYSPSVLISECIILNNFDSLFYIHGGGKFTLINNWIFHEYNFGISITNNKNEITNTISLIHLNTYLCLAQNFQIIFSNKINKIFQWKFFINYLILFLTI